VDTVADAQEKVAAAKVVLTTAAIAQDAEETNTRDSYKFQVPYFKLISLEYGTFVLDNIA
jgi:hypothetical protein